MPNIVKVTVENAGEILNAGAYGAGALIRLQTAAAEAGAFADVSGAGSTPTLLVVDGTRAYTGYDPNGITSSWYRTRYENAGGTRLSDWTVAFQVGDEAAGLICSLYDVRQRLGMTTQVDHDELLLEYIGQATTDIQGFTGRRFSRRPSSGTATFLFDVGRETDTLWIPRGIAEMTQLEVATHTGAAFEVVPTTDWFLDPPEPERDLGWPATRVVLSDRPEGTVSCFYSGKRVVRTTMAEGWTAVPGDVEAIGLNSVIRRYLARGSGVAAASSDTFAARLLRWVSPEEMAKLDWYGSRR